MYKEEMIRLGIDCIKRNNNYSYCGKLKSHHVFIDCDNVRHLFTNEYVEKYGRRYREELREIYE